MTDPLNLLLRDVLPHGTDAYVIGQLDDRLSGLLAEHGITAHQPKQGAQPLPLVVAIDGISDLAISEHQQWDEALAATVHLLAPGGTMLLGVTGESTLASLITAAPAQPTVDDSKPVSPLQIRSALKRVGLRGSTVHLLFGDPHLPRAVLSENAAREALPGTLPALVAEHALGQDASSSRPTVLDPKDAVDRAAGAGALAMAASGFLAVIGGRGRDLYADTGSDVLWAERDDHGRQWVLSDRTLPGGPNVESELRAALARADIPTFKNLAAQIGSFARTDPTAATATELPLHHLVRDADGRFQWIFPARPTDRSASEAVDLLTAAWRTFLHRLGYRRDALPWPQLHTDQDLLRAWLRMSGVQDNHAEPSVGAPVTEVTSAQLDLVTSSRANDRVTLLEQRLAIVQGALDQRERQLTVRETAIRGLRAQVLEAQESQLKAEAATAALKRGAAYKLANRITLLRDPLGLVKAIGNRLDDSVKQVRRLR